MLRGQALEDQKQKKRELLKYTFIILCIICGSFLDLVDYIADLWLYDTSKWEILHHTARELRLLGFSLLAFSAIRYDQLKLKALSFMFVIWSAIIIIYNALSPSFHPSFLVVFLYCVYLWWLLRIAFIREKKENILLSLKQLEKAGVAYNLLIPVTTFRRLLQIILVPWQNPKYETRILVANHEIVGVSQGKFVKKKYTYSQILAMIDSGARIRLCDNYRKSKVEKLMGKRLILGIRDCRKLEL